MTPEQKLIEAALVCADKAKRQWDRETKIARMLQDAALAARKGDQESARKLKNCAYSDCTVFDWGDAFADLIQAAEEYRKKGKQTAKNLPKLGSLRKYSEVVKISSLWEISYDRQVGRPEAIRLAISGGGMGVGKRGAYEAVCVEEGGEEESKP